MKHITIIAVIQVLWLGSSMVFLAEIANLKSRLARVETQASLLNAAYQLEQKHGQ